MNFASDNAHGVAPEMLAALAAANHDASPPYGEDPFTARLEATLADVFEHKVAAFPVITGTAANALALSTLVPPHGTIFCCRDAHIATDECGAPQLFTHGARLATLESTHGKVTPKALEEALCEIAVGSVHHSQPAAISIAEACELGSCYRPEEIRAIAGVAQRHRLKLHMDGARLANALAFLDCKPAELTWKAGVDVLSLGMTKNGALGAEVVVFFRAGDVGDFEFRRKRFGHLVSKMRFVSAQLVCALEHGRWLGWAAAANALAIVLANGLGEISGVEIVHPVEANLVFASMPEALVQKLRAAGASFYDWGPLQGERRLIRFVTSFMTPEGDIGRLLAACV
ncbi:MAG TPA: beta-eliminating lyase-related protein [Rhizomicrobium sp.]|nr:beta-eliminating lyase-related protein [Rhizomicrobium sp.]